MRCAAFAVVADTALVLLSSFPVLVVASFLGVEDRIVVTVADDASVA